MEPSAQRRGCNYVQSLRRDAHWTKRPMDKGGSFKGCASRRMGGSELTIQAGHCRGSNGLLGSVCPSHPSQEAVPPPYEQDQCANHRFWYGC